MATNESAKLKANRSAYGDLDNAVDHVQCARHAIIRALPALDGAQHGELGTLMTDLVELEMALSLIRSGQAGRLAALEDQHPTPPRSSEGGPF